jgi:hypothetical protein
MLLLDIEMIITEPQKEPKRATKEPKGKKKGRQHTHTRQKGQTNTTQRQNETRTNKATTNRTLMMLGFSMLVMANLCLNVLGTKA